MLYTLTTNPAIDMNFLTGPLNASSVSNRTSTPTYTPNGKGINVMRVLRHFGTASTALGFFGGFTGRYIVDELKAMDFSVLPVWVEDITRINIFFNDGTHEYKLVNSGARVNEEKQAEMIALLSGLSDMEYLAISGSLPTGIESSYYEKVLDVCKAKDTEIILDISSKKLADLLKYRPLLIKPNDEELLDIYGVKIESRADAQKACEMLVREGAKNVLLSMGEKGLYFYAGDASFYYASPVKIELVSSACAGDSCLAAFLSEFLTGGGIETALKKAAATGADVAASEGIGDLKRVQDFMAQITVERSL